MKKIVLIIIIVAIVVSAALLLYFFFFSGQTNPGEISEEITEESESSLALSGEREEDINPATGVTDITAEEIDALAEQVIVGENEAVELLDILTELIGSQVVGPTLTPEKNRLQYYDMDDEEIKSINFIGDDEISIRSTEFPAREIIWSNDSLYLVYTSDEGGKFYSQLEGLEGGTDIPLGTFVKSPVFLTGDEKIAYQFRDPDIGDSSISIGTPIEELRDYKAIAKIKGDAIVRVLPGMNKLAYYLAPNQNRQANIYLTDFSGTQTELIVSKGAGIDAKWSPDSSKMIFTKLGQNGRPLLYLADGDGRNAKKLKYATYVEKAVFSQDGRWLYLAVPTQMPKIDSFYNGQALTRDRLFMVDLETMETKLYYDFSVLEESYDLRNMFMTPEGQLMYFTNQYNDGLFVVNISKLHEISVGVRSWDD